MVFIPPHKHTWQGLGREGKAGTEKYRAGFEAAREGKGRGRSPLVEGYSRQGLRLNRKHILQEYLVFRSFREGGTTLNKSAKVHLLFSTNKKYMYFMSIVLKRASSSKI